jgi:peptidyl-prolyl cis-trans isomerase SurA
MSEDEARLQIQRLQTRILGGEDFAELARSNSDDEGSAPAGGDLGWISPGTMEPVFEQAMGTLAPGELSRPFRTRYGWHLVQVTERRDYDSGDSAMANRAREAIRKRKADEEWEFYLRRLREEAYVEIRDPELTAAGAAS